MAVITPRCDLNKIESYVSAQDRWFPCCWIGNEPYATQLRQWLGQELWQEFSLKNRSVQDMHSSAAMHKIRSSWDEGSFTGCRAFCARPITPENIERTRDRRDGHIGIDLNTFEITDE